jgi:DNA-directed RNA polymerase specialized sigma24 family protein
MWIEEFESQYRRRATALLVYARRCVGRPDVAEQIAGEAFLELLGNTGKIGAGQLPAGLYTVVERRAIGHWRRNKLEVAFAESRPDAAQPAEIPFDGGILESGGLNAAHRLSLTLRCIHGMTRDEIAEFTSLRETQVQGCLRYGLELLPKTLAGERGVKPG